MVCVRIAQGAALLRASPRNVAPASRRAAVPPCRASFSTTPSRAATNQLYGSVRRPADFHTTLLQTSASRLPLITLWTASWCAACRHVSPLVQSLVESGVGEAEGGVGFCLVEFDAPDMVSDGSDLALTYMITSIPTLLSFNDAQEPRTHTRLSDVKRLSDSHFVEQWIRDEARRNKSGTGGTSFTTGGSGLPASFGGLFGGFGGKGSGG